MRFIRTGVAVALVLAALTIPLPHAASDAPAVTLTGLSAIEEADVRWAVGLFDQAGLRLPPIEVVRHRSVQPCSGRRAAHTWKDGRSTIHLCADDKPRPRRYRMLHEIAHAWDRQSLTEARRAAFLDLRGLDEWRNDDPERWHERGAEHAAEIMVWGLIDRPVRSVFIPDTTCAELRAGYEVLVGEPPLHGFTDRC
jgi:hypothetical protein